MSGNDSETLKQLSPVSNVVSSQGGGGAMDILNNGGVVSGVVYRKLSFRSDDANATPMTGYGDESTVATGIAEGDLDDGSVIFAGGGAARGLVRDKWGRIISTCGIAGCQRQYEETQGRKAWDRCGLVFLRSRWLRLQGEASRRPQKTQSRCS